MNYRHYYHAGNYADVFKHVLLVQLTRAMQRKEKGFLYLDTHAGRGSYDLTTPSALPQGRARATEFPDGIGRVWNAVDLPPALANYRGIVRDFNDRRGGGDELVHYPGSPWIVRSLLRTQDRMVLSELRFEDAEALDQEFARERRVIVTAMDGYAALKAHLPPPEKRALVLIDPPFEEENEFAAIEDGLRAALARLAGAVCAVWYPITERAATDGIRRSLIELNAPTLCAELQVATNGTAVRMKGCGLLVLNPPWRIDEEFRAALPGLKDLLKVDAQARTECTWLVPDR